MHVVSSNALTHGVYGNAENRFFPFSFPFLLDFREKTVTLSVNGITDHCF